jgi:hypothetical protein
MRRWTPRASIYPSNQREGLTAIDAWCLGARKLSLAPPKWCWDIVNDVRIGVWAGQSDAFFAEAVIDMDGTLVPTSGQCKQGMDIAYDGTWGYHPLCRRRRARLFQRAEPYPRTESSKAPARRSVLTNCLKKSARAASAKCSWPSRGSRSAAKWP